MSDSHEKNREAHGVPPGEDTRRDFLKTVGIGGISLGLGAVAGAPGIAYVAYPIFHATVSGSGGFVKIGKSDNFKEGKPAKVDIFADKRDAWNRIVKVRVGSAWVMREGGKLRAYSTVCPHLGCAVDFDSDVTKFKCPCHHSTFNLDGKVEGGPAPRGMDELELEETDGAVSVRYQRFRQGIAEKETV
ncbi:MAG TPA: Rieske (2Fe-2S) protein [Polyangiaceae bacterium]|nr:Rieske (2Fe-2S) protein [Polyangiaceae bacterium]